MIMTNKLGEKGATLAVLAREVRNMSDESSLKVTDFLNVLESIDASAENGNGDAPKRSSSLGGDDVDRLLEEGGRGVTSAIENSLTIAAGAAEGACVLKGNIEEVCSGLTFFLPLIRRMKDNRKRIGEVAAWLAPWADMTGTKGAGQMAGVASRYTMDSERRLHEEMVKKSEALTFDGTGSGEEDVSAGVDLFDSHAPSGDNFELFDSVSDESPGDNVDPVESKSEENLGGNVELF